MSSSIRQRRLVVLLALVVAVLAAGPFVPIAAAGDNHDHRTKIWVTWTSDPAEVAPDSVLAPTCNFDKQCVTAWLGPLRTLRGDLVGQTIGGGVAAPLVNGEPGVAAAVGVGTLTESPCGAGSFVATGIFFSNPTSGDAGRWEIVPRAGTGHLSNAIGSGRVTTAGNGQTLVYSGWMSCNAS